MGTQKQKEISSGKFFRFEILISKLCTEARWHGKDGTSFPTKTEKMLQPSHSTDSHTSILENDYFIAFYIRFLRDSQHLVHEHMLLATACKKSHAFVLFTPIEALNTIQQNPEKHS